MASPLTRTFGVNAARMSVVNRSVLQAYRSTNAFKTIASSSATATSLTSSSSSSPLYNTHRSISFSALRAFATPSSSTSTSTSPSHLESGPIKTPHPIEASTKTAASDAAAKKAEAGGLVYEDYSKGPSALDKAAQLFFFTEILRGE